MAADRSSRSQSQSRSPALSKPDGRAAGSVVDAEAEPSHVPPLRSKSTWWRSAGWLALLAVAVGVAFEPSFRGGFVLDDHGSILENRSILSLRDLWTVLTGARFATVVGRPLLNLSLAIDHALHGENPSPYHVVNVGSHLLATWLLFALVRRTLALPAVGERLNADASVLAFSVALLWAVHPLQVQSVTYICQRAESLSAVCYLLTLYGLLRGVTGPRPSGWFVLSVVAAWVGVATKEVAATAPVVALLYDRTFLAGSFRRALSERRWLHGGLFASWGLLAVLMASSNQREGSAGFGLGISPLDYLVTQGWFLSRYLSLSFWPEGLVADYGGFLVSSVDDAFLQDLFIAILLGVSAWAVWSWPFMGFVGAWFFLILAPTSSIVPLAGQTGAEHRMYLPLAAVVLATVLALRQMARLIFPSTDDRRGPSKAALFVLMLAIPAAAALTAVTRERHKIYERELWFWQDTAAKMPKNARAWNGIGAAQMEREEYAAAIENFDRAIRLHPGYVQSHGGRGVALLELGRIDEGIEELTTTLRLKPTHLITWLELARGYSLGGRHAEALKYLGDIERRVPPWSRLHHEKGLVYARQKDHVKSLQEFETAVSINPKFLDARLSRAQEYERLGRWAEAEADLTFVIDRRSHDPRLYARRSVARAKLGNDAAARADLDMSRRLEATLAAEKPPR